VALMRGVFSLTAWVGGLLLLFIGERVLGPGHPGRIVFAVLAAAALLTALGARMRLASSADDSTRAVLSWLIPAYIAGLVSVALYALVAVDSPVAVAEGDLRTVLICAFLLLLSASTLPLVFMEASLASMAGARTLESRRLIEAGRAGLAIALVLGFVGFANYVGADRDEKIDMRTYRSLVATQATQEMVRNLTEPVTVTLFFPPANDVAETILPYFEDLAEVSDLLTIQRIDRDMQPAKAKEMRARKNGTVVVSVGDTHETITLAVKPGKARSKLKKLDGDFQKKLAKVTQEQKVAYFVTGHGERSTSPRADDLPGLKVVKEILQRMNFKVKKLGPKDGLGNQIPEDATLVFLPGPTTPMLDAELQSLVDYVQGGGGLFVLIDPDVEEDLLLDPLLETLGLEVGEGVLTHDRKFFPFRGARSDRTFLLTTRFSTHDSTTVLSKISSQVALFLDGTSYLKKREGTPAPADGGPDVQFTVRSVAGTWADLDADLDFDKETEKKDVYQLVAAVELPVTDGAATGGRAIVAADADLAADLIIGRSKGNVQWLHDAVRWLEDDVVLMGEVADIEDVPVQHTKDGESLWFWTTTFGVPLLIFGIGLGVNRRTSRRASA
jgi:hypothetical protein